MMRRCLVPFDSPANDMVQEEILKQVAHVSRFLRNASFEDASHLAFDAPEEVADEVMARVAAIALRVKRGLRSLTRNIVYRSHAADAPRFRDAGASATGLHFLGTGQVALWGTPLRLFEYFDRTFSELAPHFRAEKVRVPTLIPTNTLARCDYLRSFPHTVTFAAHLEADSDVIDRFRREHAERTDLADDALRSMSRPEAALSPAVCYHTYSMNEGKTIPAQGIAYSVVGKCFRYESSNLSDLRRLWDFTMREVVLLGSREQVLAERLRAVDLVAAYLETHSMAAELRTASDPFFLAPDAVAKTYFQLSSDTKWEISALLPNEERLAVGSLNYHSDFFGRAFNVSVEGAAAMHSVCIAFGLERWVYAFLAQHGVDVHHWPEIVRRAPEFAT
jgi:seryl-tRNA synthetase